MTVTIMPIKEQIGAEVRGVNVRSPLDPDVVRLLADAWAKHQVLVLHDQDITDDQQVAFTRCFGTVAMTMVNDPYGGGGPINRISNVDGEGRLIPHDDSRSAYGKGNQLWHSDGSFKPVALRASLLSAKVVPPEGGQTEFASVRAAYASLPAGRQAEMEGLVVEHSMTYSRLLIGADLVTQSFAADVPPVHHPLVRTIGATGQKAFLIGSYCSHIIDWPVDKGRALLDELLVLATQPDYVYSHRWRARDLVMWDNYCCLHRGRPWDGARYKRIMHRTTLAVDAAVT